jgi:hypothetical protein
MYILVQEPRATLVPLVLVLRAVVLRVAAALTVAEILLPQTLAAVAAVLAAAMMLVVEKVAHSNISLEKTLITTTQPPHLRRTILAMKLQVVTVLAARQTRMALMAGCTSSV